MPKMPHSSRSLSSSNGLVVSMSGANPSRGAERQPIRACHRICRLPHEPGLKHGARNALPDPRRRPARLPPARKEDRRRAGARRRHLRRQRARRACASPAMAMRSARASSSTAPATPIARPAGQIEQAGGGWALVPAGDGDCRIPLSVDGGTAIARRRDRRPALIIAARARASRASPSRASHSRDDAGDRLRGRSALLTFTET